MGKLFDKSFMIISAKYQMIMELDIITSIILSHIVKLLGIFTVTDYLKKSLYIMKLLNSCKA